MAGPGTSPETGGWSAAMAHTTADDCDHGPAAQNLQGLIDRLESACGREHRVTVRQVEQAIGERSFGPLLLVPALLAMSPLGVIPGAPTVLALVVALIAGQLVIGRHEFWIPRFLANRSVKGERLTKSLERVRPAARVVDRVLKPRLCRLTGAFATRATALVCLLIAFLIPPLELAPFAVFAPAAAIAAFGLGLMTRDGLLVLIALAASATSVGLVVWAVLR